MLGPAAQRPRPPSNAPSFRLVPPLHGPHGRNNHTDTSDHYYGNCNLETGSRRQTLFRSPPATRTKWENVYIKFSPGAWRFPVCAQHHLDCILPRMVTQASSLRGLGWTERAERARLLVNPVAGHHPLGLVVRDVAYELPPAVHVRSHEQGHHLARIHRF